MWSHCFIELITSSEIKNATIILIIRQKSNIKPSKWQIWNINLCSRWLWPKIVTVDILFETIPNYIRIVIQIFNTFIRIFWNAKNVVQFPWVVVFATVETIPLNDINFRRNFWSIEPQNFFDVWQLTSPLGLPVNFDFIALGQGGVIFFTAGAASHN